MPLVLRLDFRPQPNMSDDMVAINAADCLVVMVSALPDLVFSYVELVTSILGHDMYAHPASTRESVLGRWNEDREKNRSRAYVCSHCGVSSSKDLWGPGRITCPKCGWMADAADGTPRP